MRALLVLFILLLCAPVLAVPTISNCQVRHQELWIGESNNIYLTCSDSVAIDSVYANITGPNVTLPTLYFENISTSYNLTIDSSYFDRIGVFNATVACNNTNGETATTETQIDVSKLTGYISNATSFVYVGDIIEIDFMVMKNNVNLTEGVSFEVEFNNQDIELRVPPAYDANKGWLLKMDAESEGDYTAHVYAFYDRANVTKTTGISVRNEIEFEFSSVSKTNVEAGDTIKVVLKSADKGTPVDLNADNLYFELGSENPEILNITKSGSYYNVELSMPELDYGRYDLYAYLLYKGTNKINTTIDYPLSIEGNLVENAKLKFTSGDRIVTMTADSNGDYSGFLLPGTYTVDVELPKSNMRLFTTKINNYSDSIKYWYIETDIEGINVVDAHVYETDLDFYMASIDMFYEGEDDVRLFRCSEWDSATKECHDWQPFGATINTNNNSIHVEIYNLSAFAIGRVKRMLMDFAFDKDVYALKDLVRVSGKVYDEDNSPVENAMVKLHIGEASSTTFTDSSGDFSLDFIAPDYEGTHEVLITASRYGFIETNSTRNIETERISDVSIIFPETVKVEAGSSLEKELKIINIGQEELTNLKIEISGIDDYYFMKKEINKLDIGETETIGVRFFVPSNKTTETLSAVISVSGDVSKEKIFGFTIEEKIEKEPAGPTGFFVNIDFSQITSYLNSILFILAFATVSFTLAFFWKRKKRSHKDLAVIMDIKSHFHHEKHREKDEGILMKLKDEIINAEKKFEKPKKEEKEDKIVFGS